VTSPWAGLRVTSAFGWWFFPVIAIGFAFLVGLGGRRPKAAVIGLAGAGALIGAGVLFFALRFDTYVPRWTGLVRFGQYAPLLAGVAVAFAAGGYVRLWSWLAEIHVPRLAPLIVALLGVLWLLPTAATRYSAEAQLPAAGLAALEEVNTRAHPGDIVLSNALTTGTIESFTGLEAPLEGRQPLIEEPGFLASANQLLLDAHRWFENPADRSLIDRLGVHWVLAADSAATLGAPAFLGGSAAGLASAAGLHQVWSAPGITLYEVVDAKDEAGVRDAKRPLVNVPRAIVIGLVGLLLGALLIAPARGLEAARRVVRVRILPRRRRKGA
jgi:hypothetical protein